ncbi:MAG: glycosyltransferase family 9 protein [Bacteroidia bacterium]|nr:glycosyltransferase family 9 protein [Bacteroidia bacterium]
MKILVLRFSSIGDIVLTTPVLRCLKQQLPEVEIHYLTKPQFTSVLEHNPFIDKLHALDAQWLKQALTLKRENFDCIIDLHHNFRSTLISAIIGAPAHRFNKANIAKWLMVRFNINVLPQTHIVDRYLNTLQTLGVVNDEQGLEYYLPKGIEQTLPALPLHYVAVAIGAQHYTKRMPTSKWIDLVNQAPQTQFVLLGGKEDIDAANEIVNNTPGHVQSFCGQLSLNQSAAIVRNAQQVITHDTGLMHIAAAFQKPISSIWGNTIPEFGMYPYFGNNSQTVSIMHQVPGIPCRPCSKIGHNACPKKHFNCMLKQDVEAIAKELPNS